MSTSLQEQFHELSFYTLAHPDTSYFIHQHIVDAYQAQTATCQSKPITIAFSLLGLYLYIEKGYTGMQVQLAHMNLAKNKRPWPQLDLPKQRGRIKMSDVLEVAAGDPRDLMIRKWCEEVWTAYSPVWHEAIAALADEVRHLKR